MSLPKIIVLFLVSGTFFVPAAAWAAHPLITDDAGTQGTGRFQLEVNGQYDRDREAESNVIVESRGGVTAATLSYGFVANADVVLTQPYLWETVREDGRTVYDQSGISDTILEVKWRFFDREGLLLAVKPGVTIPVGDRDRGLGSGKVGYHAFLIMSREADPWAVHVNLGYFRNENVFDERKDLWHASLAATYQVTEDITAVGNIGIERSPDRASDNDPAFLLGGVIYSINDDFDVDVGGKGALSTAETDVSLMAGTAYRF